MGEGETAALLADDVERGNTDRSYGALPRGEDQTTQFSPPPHVTSHGFQNVLRFVVFVNLGILAVSALFSLHYLTKTRHPFFWTFSEPPVRFLSVGDWGRGGEYNQSRIAYQMGEIGSKIKSQFVISTGDNFYESGLKSENDPFFKKSFTKVYTARSLQTQWYAVLGNHDYYGDVLAQLNSGLTNRDSRWFCVRSGQLSKTLCQSNAETCKQSESLEFFLFDTVPMVKSYRTSPKHVDWRGINTSDWEAYNRRQVEELDSALASSSARWKIVVGHHPLYSYGHHGSQPELIESLKPIMEKWGVDIYLNGHDHCMQHIKRDDSPIHYITCGGGSKAFTIIDPTDTNGLKYWWEGQGFTSFQVSRNYLRVDFYGVDGVVLHKIDLNK